MLHPDSRGDQTLTEFTPSQRLLRCQYPRGRNGKTVCVGTSFPILTAKEVIIKGRLEERVEVEGL